MLSSSLSLISIVVSQIVFQKIIYLWQELINQSELDGTYFSQNNFKKKNRQNSAHSFPDFQLFIAPKIQVLLLVEKEIEQTFYQITITFDQQEILDFLELSQKDLVISATQKRKIESILKNTELHPQIQPYFLFSLLKILTEDLTIEGYVNHDHSLQPIETIIKNKIAQEKILHQVTQQIQQDLDPLMIVNMTIEQILSLLQVDRVLIYQMNISVKSPTKKKIETGELIDVVTYEAKNGDKIPSLLNYSEESCFHTRPDCFQKYLQEFCLVVEDVEQYHFDHCLQQLMHTFGVKAKVVIPIIVQSQLWGLLIVHQCFRHRQWKSSEIKFLQNIAEYLALAIYQYKSYQQLKEQKQLLQEQIENKAKQLQDALIVAQIANKSKTEFLGSISHELRTPLTCVIGLSGTMLHWLKEPSEYHLPLEKRIRYLEMIQDSGRKLLQLISNILDFADLEAGKSLLNIQPFSLENLAKTIESAGKDIALHHGVNVILDYQVAPNLDLFNADQERVFQILLNIVDNGIKFTPEGGDVIIQFRRNQKQVIFQVKDTGIGIAKEQIPLLFTQFQQLENYLNRSYPGTGLGLALTKHLVELHNGIIEVESTIGEGSIFTIILPDYEEKIKTKTLTQSAETDKNKEINMNRTIVIICNDEEIGTFLCELLTAANYQIIWLLDEQEAITRIRLIKPIIVILEQEKEVIFKISQTIKSKVNQSIHIIVIQDELEDEQWQEISNAGVDDYLLKPLQPRILLHKISEVVNNIAIQIDK
jgi:two-component system sensor histidine kinase/response regulator